MLLFKSSVNYALVNHIYKRDIQVVGGLRRRVSLRKLSSLDMLAAASLVQPPHSLTADSISNLKGSRYLGCPSTERTS
jgi:hypothetical protein